MCARKGGAPGAWRRDLIVWRRRRSGGRRVGWGQWEGGARGQGECGHPLDWRLIFGHARAGNAVRVGGRCAGTTGRRAVRSPEGSTIQAFKDNGWTARICGAGDAGMGDDRRQRGECAAMLRDMYRRAVGCGVAAQRWSGG